jgi:hypothetical protein
MEEGRMLCALTVRRIKPGSYESFRKAWEPDEWPPALTRAVIMRNDDAEDEIASMGFFDLTEDEFDALRDDPAFLSSEDRRLRRIAEYEEAILLNGVFRVAEEVIPPGR